MPDIIDATVTSGFGVANKNIKFQLPHLVQQFPEIKNIYPGSINVLFDKPLPALKFDYTTSPVRWWDAGPDQWQIEIFSFLAIEFEYPLNGALYRAWLFDCHNSAYHRAPMRFEVISEKINGVSNGQRCRVHMP